MPAVGCVSNIHGVDVVILDSVHWRKITLDLLNVCVYKKKKKKEHIHTHTTVPEDIFIWSHVVAHGFEVHPFH